MNLNKHNENYMNIQNTKITKEILNLNVHKSFLQMIGNFLLMVLILSFSVLLKFKPEFIFLINIKHKEFIFLAINLILFILCILFSFKLILEGIKNLISRKGSIKTLLAICCVLVFIQSIIAVLIPYKFFPFGKIPVYTGAASIIIFCYSFSKFYTVFKARKNHSFIFSPFEKFTIKISSNNQLSQKITNIKKPFVAFKTKNESKLDISKFAHEPYIDSFISYKVVLTILGFAFVVCILELILSKNIFNALTILTFLLCICIPAGGFAAISIKEYLLCKKLLKKGFLFNGIEAIKNISKTNCIVVDACDIYPSGTVKLKGIKTFGSRGLDDALICAAAVSNKAKSPLEFVFDKVIMGRRDVLPKVESVSYEYKNGVVSWVNGKRILIGNRNLMQKYGVNTLLPNDEKEYTKNETDITYFSYAGELTALFILEYMPDIKIEKEMKNLEKFNIKLMVKTSDSNITSEKIAKDFYLYPKNIIILSHGEDVELKNEKSKCNYTSIIRNKFVSFSSGITQLKKAKNNIRFIMLIQIISILLAISIALLLIFCSSVSRLGQIELILYLLFWNIVLILTAFLSKY